MLDLNGNLKWAMLAVEYTNSVTPLPHPLNKVCTFITRKIEDKHGASGAQDHCDIIRNWAARASRFRCGNCAEQAAIAFLFLLQKGIVPIDYMGFLKKVNHALVVVGRAHGSSVANVETWGRLAVVCDPYENLCYPALPVNQGRPMHKYFKVEKPIRICSKYDAQSRLKPMKFGQAS